MERIVLEVQKALEVLETALREREEKKLNEIQTHWVAYLKALANQFVRESARYAAWGKRNPSVSDLLAGSPLPPTVIREVLGLDEGGEPCESR